MAEQPLNFTQKGIRPINKLLMLSLVSIILMVLDNRYSAVQQAKSIAATALYPLQWFANQPVRLYEYISSFTQAQAALLTENQSLKQENGRLKILIKQNEIQQAELNELKNLHALKQNGIRSAITAEVISNGKNPLSDKLIINRGSNQGVNSGDAVVDSNGLIGQITQTQAFNSELTLLTNSQNVIPVMIARTGVRSLLYGSGGSVSLRYFPIDADLRPDDILVTSGLDSIYPMGIPIAKTTQVIRVQGSPYYRVTLEPLSHFRSSKYVMVLPQKNSP
ncbi:TPA: rod shape-determining protein MreC [Neisseria weaveri]